MNKQEFIAALEKLNLPKTEFIILSGGSYSCADFAKPLMTWTFVSQRN